MPPPRTPFLGYKSLFTALMKTWGLKRWISWLEKKLGHFAIAHELQGPGGVGRQADLFAYLVALARKGLLFAPAFVIITASGRAAGSAGAGTLALGQAAWLAPTALRRAHMPLWESGNGYGKGIHMASEHNPGISYPAGQVY